MSGSIHADVGYKFQFSNRVFANMEMQARKRIHAKRPDLWAKDVLDVTLWSKQVDVAMSIVNNHSTMVAAGHGVGKSYLTAVLACWWIDTHPIGEARVLSTAPTTAQVRGIVWREIQLMHRKASDRHKLYLEAKKNGEDTTHLPDHPLPGYITSSATWRNFDGLELGAGRTPPRGREGDAFQGIHGGVFAIADEAVGVSEDMIQTLRNNTTANDDRILMIANPTNPVSAMGQMWNDPKKSSLWSKITISVLESPKFTDEGKTLPESVMKYMTDKDYVESKKVEYGEDSANYISRVLGQWAMDSGMIVFLDEVLEMGKATTVIPGPNDPVNLGFDVARSENGDWSYLYTAQEGEVHQTHEWALEDPNDPQSWNEVELDKPRPTGKRGIKIRYLDRWRGLPFFPVHNQFGQRTVPQAANEKVHAHMLEIGAKEIRIDADGMGGQMIDHMIDISHGEYRIVDIRGNDPSPDKNTWYNLRAYSYMELARRMRAGEVDIESDDSDMVHPLCKELGVLEYKFASGYAESILILSKREMREKGIKSPDAADAANYASMKIALEEGLEIGEMFGVSDDLYGIYSTSNAFW
ncbi:terminase [Microbacterium phage Musetta]|nr:terminase [Microbacterium phage Fork]AXH50195.1 terminase [Microbacterium phage Musetta]QYC54158.1 terminase [Microbacterium phage Welcome]UVK62453.1 terminase [Microbacterium phage Yuma]WMI33910.1 terminase [Microbacterium phage Erenyeager]